MNPIAKFLVLAGLLLVAAGLLFLLADKLPWLGKIPGDITIRRDRFTFYFPLGTCILLSVILSLLYWLFRK